MRILLLSDSHWRGFHEFCRTVEDDTTEYLEQLVASYKWIRELIETHRPDLVVDLGDNAYTIGLLDSLTITGMSRGFAVLDDAVDHEQAIFWRLVGNHDKPSISGYVNSVNFSKALIVKPELVDDNLFMPYTANIPIVESTIEKLQPRVVFSHLDILGAKWSSEKSSPWGLDTSKYPDVFFFNGHIHEPHRIGQNTINVGSLMYASFKDRLSEVGRGVVLFEGDRPSKPHKLTWIPNPHTPIFHQFASPVPLDLEKFLGEHSEDIGRLYVRFADVAPEYEDDVKIFGEMFRGYRMNVLRKPKNVVSQGVDPEDWQRSLSELPEAVRADAQAVLQKYVTADELSVQVPLTIQTLNIENFLSWKKLYLDFTRMGTGVVSVEGINRDSVASESNGAGKSAIWEALRWSLTGDLLQRNKSKADSVIREGSTEGCKVVVEFSKGGSDYIVERYRGHPVHGNGLRFYKDGAEQTSRTPSLTEKDVKRALGIPPTIFDKTVILSGPQLATQRFSILTESARVQFVEDVSGVYIYRLAIDDIRKQKTAAENNLVKVRAQLTSSTDLSGQLQSELTASEDRAREEIALVETKERELKEKILGLNRRTLEVAGSLDEEAPKTYEQEVGRLAETRQSYIRTLDVWRAKDATLTSQIRGVELAIRSIEGGFCSACGQSVSVDIRAQYDDKLLALKEMVDPLKVDMDDIRDKLTQVDREASDCNEQLAEARQQVRLIKNQVDSLTRDRDDALRALDDVGKTLERAKKAQESILKQQADLAQTLVTLQGQVDEAERVCLQLANLLDSLVSLRKRTFSATIDAMNSLHPRYCDLMTSGEHVAHIQSDGESLKYEINGDVEKYHSLSSGQRSRVDLATYFSSVALVPCNLVVADEIDQQIDQAGCDRLVDLLEEVGQNRLVFFTSHNPRMKSISGRTLTVVLENKVTSLLEK